MQFCTNQGFDHAPLPFPDTFARGCRPGRLLADRNHLGRGPYRRHRRVRGKVNLAKAQVQTLADKIQQYQGDTGSLPGTLGDLVKAPSGTAGWLGPYAKEVEMKDPWNHPYVYVVPGQGKPFDLTSLGADGQPGGDSVNADIHYE
jgi:type II secretion system protein G